jgi:hypothetical protein
MGEKTLSDGELAARLLDEAAGVEPFTRERRSD